MSLQFISPHCPDVIEVRTAGGRTVGAIRLEGAAFVLFGLESNQLHCIDRYASLSGAKAAATNRWGKPA